MIPGLVPVWEERDAAVKNGYNFTEWRELDSAERAYAIAYYRAARLIEIHQSDATSAEMERWSRVNQTGQNG